MTTKQFIPGVFTAVLYDGTNASEVEASLKPVFGPPVVDDELTRYDPECSQADGVLTIHYDGNDEGSGPIEGTEPSGTWIVCPSTGEWSETTRQKLDDTCVDVALLLNG